MRETPCDGYSRPLADPLEHRCVVCGHMPHDHTEQRNATAPAESPNHDRRGKFAPGNKAGTGGKSRFEVKLRGLLKDDAYVARNFLRNTLEGKNLNGEPDAGIEHVDKQRAADAILKYTLPLPKQTVRMEGGARDPLADLTAEALVAFIKNGGGK